jgi:hypothetical protein
VQGGAGVFVSIIAVTHGSEKQTTKLKKKTNKKIFTASADCSFVFPDGR